jgi:hypothetical protein
MQPTLWGDETDLDDALTGQQPLFTQEEAYRHTVLPSTHDTLELIPFEDEKQDNPRLPYWKRGQYA